MSTKNLFLSQLLPYEPCLRKNGSLQIGLKEFHALLRALKESHLCIRSGNLEKFDSLVGENSCQIRAVWLASLNFISKSSLFEQIEKSLKKIDDLLASKSIDSLMRSDGSLKDILENHEIDVSLTDEEVFLLQSYLLSEMKTVKISEESLNTIYRIEAGEPKNFIRFGNVSVSFARNLLSKLRRSLATSSVQFVRDHALQSQDVTLQKMSSQEFTHEQNTLPCIPMFWAYKTMLQTAQKHGIPIVAHVKFLQRNDEGYSLTDQECIFFKTTSRGYVMGQPNEADLDRPACVIQGIAVVNDVTKTEWTARMEEIGIIDAVLAGAADHRQYPNPELDHCIHTLRNDEFNQYRALAQKEGFSSDNPSTFFIQHVYAAQVEKFFEEICTQQPILTQFA